MGWEMRRNGIYYYRTVRDGSRTRKVYCGGGEKGRQAAEADHAARAARADARRLRAEQRHPIDEFAASLAQLREGGRPARDVSVALRRLENSITENGGHPRMVEIETMAEVDAGQQVGYRFGLGVDNEAAEATAPFDGSSVSGLRCEASAAAAVESSIKDSRPDPSARPGQADKVNPAQRTPTTSQRSTTKTRPAGTTSRTDKATTGSARYVPEAALRAELAQLEALSNAALAGDLTAIDKLRIELDRSPHVWRYVADLQVAVEIKMIRLVAGDSPLRQEAFRKRCSEFRRQLVG